VVANCWLLGWIAPLVLGAHPPAQQQTINDILDPLSSAECNSHLVMFVLDLVLMTLIPEMGNITDASMMDGPPPMVPTQPQPVRRVPSQTGSNVDESGDNGDEKGKHLSPSQSSATTGMYVHV